jgi:uncharacterized protein
MADALRVQVSYALPDRQVVLDLSVTVGTTVQQAIGQSGILQQFPEIDLGQNRVGIFSKVKPLDTVLREHDRVEIYRPLNADAKEARRKRVAKK